MTASNITIVLQYYDHGLIHVGYYWLGPSIWEIDAALAKIGSIKPVGEVWILDSCYLGFQHLIHAVSAFF